jgi:multidrug resistance protein, MATE family
VAQAFGAQNYIRCGELLQRTIVIHLLVVVPLVTVLWLNTEKMLIALGQPPEIVKLTAEFLHWRLPAIPFICIAEDISYFLKAQRVMVPTMMLMILSNIASIILAAMFILPHSKFAMGFKGGPLALSIANVFQCVCLMLFGRCFIAHELTWPRWSIRSAFSEWGEVLAMAIPSALGIWGEW